MATVCHRWLSVTQRSQLASVLRDFNLHVMSQAQVLISQQTCHRGEHPLAYTCRSPDNTRTPSVFL